MADRTVGSEFGDKYEIPGFITWLVKNRYLEDMSWHNDTSPSFGVTGNIRGTNSQGEVRIFVEHPFQSHRQYQGKRFMVLTGTDSVGENQETWEFNELEDALQKLFEVIISRWEEYESIPGIWSLLLDDSDGDPGEALDILKRKYYHP